MRNPAPEPVLSARKRQILHSVIQHYVVDVRPVSSQALAEQVAVSSATVRNELAMLEELGYLRQPHTSGGRIPTDLAYRFFVEELAQRLTDTLSQRARVEQVYSQLGSETEALLEGTLDLLTAMTGQVAWISLPEGNGLAIKSVAFVEMDVRTLLLMLVTGNGTLHSRVVQLRTPVADLGLGLLSEQLNAYLRGRSLLEVDYNELRALFSQAEKLPETVIGALEDFFSGLALGGERVLFGNALRLVLQPEFGSPESLHGVLDALHDKEQFVAVLRSQLDEAALQTIIGSENSDSNLHDCSLVVSRFTLPGVKADGTLGVLGPTRQHYERSLSWVKVIGEAVARALGEIGREHQT